MKPRPTRESRKKIHVSKKHYTDLKNGKNFDMIW